MCNLINLKIKALSRFYFNKDFLEKARYLNVNMDVRKGRFLQSSPDERKKYLLGLGQRIRQGFYDTDKVVEGVADKILNSIDGQISEYYRIY